MENKLSKKYPNLEKQGLLGLKVELGFDVK